jgi:hypothetical protein
VIFSIVLAIIEMLTLDDYILTQGLRRAVLSGVNSRVAAVEPKSLSDLTAFGGSFKTARL